MTYKCEHCGQEEETENELGINHRDCRLKAAFPGAYTDKGDGLIAFDMGKVAESLGLFSDIIVGRDGQPLHPLEGDLHFRIGAGWQEPEIWIQLPVQVGNQLSSFSYRLSEQEWLRLVENVKVALEMARQYIKQKR